MAFHDLKIPQVSHVGCGILKKKLVDVGHPTPRVPHVGLSLMNTTRFQIKLENIITHYLSITRSVFEIIYMSAR